MLEEQQQLPASVGSNHQLTSTRSNIITTTTSFQQQQLQHHQHQQTEQRQQTVVSCSEHLLEPNGRILGRRVAECLLKVFPTLVSAIPTSNRPALCSSSAVQQQAAMSHSEIRDFLLSAGHTLRHQLQLGRGHRVAVVLPNGPELALAILAISNWCCCVPLNALGAASSELANDLCAANMDHVIGLTRTHETYNPEIERIANKYGIPYTGLQPHPTKAGFFELVVYKQQLVYQKPRHLLDDCIALHRSTTVTTCTSSEADRSAGGGQLVVVTTPLQEEDIDDDVFLPNQHDDHVLLLFTSGTTGSKKLVPHILKDVLVATACIAVSWKLSPEDTNCNLMPLFHVGGIIRQVYSPILSGGCVICCRAFDPTVFWSLLQQQRFTWYYAAPTMHQILLQSVPTEGDFRLRMIANAAGGLLPSLARELRQVFRAHVLPSYGMTECMPISSPPAHYMLEKPGTSGVAVGPEIAILNLTTLQELEHGTEGPICVRGAPCFRGYGRIAGEKQQPAHSSLLPGGWFNTGDLGFLDADGYLYITGRSKEVINRGGEIISPLEVEEAVGSHPSVTACVAFSTQHNVLQEVVGIVLVPARNMPRIDLPMLHEYLQTRLTPPKWPQCLVYMDAVPKSFTNKLLRVRLGKRLSLPELSDTMSNVEKTFQAKCPPIGAAVSVAIPCERVSVSAIEVQHALRASFPETVVVPHANKIGALVAYVRDTVNRSDFIAVARERLHAYAVPGHVCLCYTSPVEALEQQVLPPPQPSDAVGSILQEASVNKNVPVDPLILNLQELMQLLLDLDCLPAPDTSFFNLGGSSMLASQLASKIRKQHNVPFGGAEVFHVSSCDAIANVIRERRGENMENGSESRRSVDPSSLAASSLFSLKLDLSNTPFEATRLEPQSGFGSFLFQLVPLLIVYPLWQMGRFFAFFRLLLFILNTLPGERNLYKFVLTLVVFHSVWVTVTPLLFVVLKWLIIGQYRKGRYPIWSNYYLRWWFCDVLRKLIGRGSWGAHPQSLAMYYRMLGARIGAGARISSMAEIAEFDLVDIGEGAAIEYSTVRGFGVDNGCMIMGPVSVGNFASVGNRSVVAPYTVIQDNQHLGPVTSSYEISANEQPTASHLRYNRQAFKPPSMFSQLFIINPITFFVNSVSHIPALLVLVWMLATVWNLREPFRTMGDLLIWLANPRRIPFYVGIRIVRSLVAPLFRMAAAIFVKRTIIGKFEPGPRDTESEWQLIRHELAASLFTRENMQDVTEIIGRHHGLVSVLYRLLGAKVGERVFWPGRQPVFTGEFDLLEIGDDVVFGSRSSLICTTVDSCEKIILCAGSNVSDNTVVLPGSILGKGAVLGSNSVCPEGRYLPESSVWFGSRGGEPVLLEKGNEESNGPIQSSSINVDKLQMEGDESTIRPFGRAVYNGDADYFVFPVSLVVIYTIAVRVIIAFIATLPVLGALNLAAGYLYGWPPYSRIYNYVQVSPFQLYTVLLCFGIATHFVRVLIWISVEVGSKWFFMGRREEGRFNWDTSNYGQNWELYQIISPIRELGRLNMLDFICGTPYMASFFRLLGCKIGDDCCLYPAGSDPLMPEPDLVEIGDRCVIDCASVVCHLNTRGNFELAKIKLHDNVTLRTRARIQQGVIMESGSMLLEKSLAMTGEVIESDSVWVGAPAARLLNYDTSSIGTRYSGSQNGEMV